MSHMILSRSFKNHKKIAHTATNIIKDSIYDDVQTGLRFSRNAAIPSFWSFWNVKMTIIANLGPTTLTDDVSIRMPSQSPKLFDFVSEAKLSAINFDGVIKKLP